MWGDGKIEKACNYDLSTDPYSGTNVYELSANAGNYHGPFSTNGNHWCNDMNPSGMTEKERKEARRGDRKDARAQKKADRKAGESRKEAREDKHEMKKEDREKWEEGNYGIRQSIHYRVADPDDIELG